MVADEVALPDRRLGLEDSRVWQMLYRFQRDGVLGAIGKLRQGGSTPLSTYNPDWAVTSGRGQGPAVPLVSGSKSDFNALRDDEIAKVRCGEAHFRAIGVDFVKAVKVEDILERLIGT